MKTKGQFLSPERQKKITPYETAARQVVGYSQNYPAGLMANTHSHSCAQLLYAVSGVMHVETKSSNYIIPPSTSLLLPTEMKHSIYMEGPVAMRCLFINGSAADRICKTPKVIAVSPLLRELIISACEEPLEWDLNGRGYFLTELALDEVERSSVLPFDLPMPSDNRLCKVVNAIKKQPNDSRSLLEWAELANVSDRTLARLFRKETGISFTQWRLQARLIASMVILSSGGHLTEALSISGFNSQSAFGAAFRRFFSITPGDARTLSLGLPRKSPTYN